MNLLCPSCQNPLSVPEQYAGQLMKCPLCGNNFTVPPLPHDTPEPSLAPPHEPDPHDFTPIDLSGPPPVPPAPPPPTVPASTESEHGLYGMTIEPPPPPRPARPTPPSPPAPAPAPPPAYKSTPPPPPPRPTPDGFTHTRAITINPQVLPWIAPACLCLVFVLSFFPWVGYYPGGYGVVTQSAWGAAFGGYSVDPVFNIKEHWTSSGDSDKPGAGALMIIFLILGLLPAVLVSLAAIALPHLKQQFQLPPGAVKVEPWRWMIVSGAALIAFLFLFLQVLTSFSIESKTRRAVAQSITKDTTETEWVGIQEGEELGKKGLYRTAYLRLSLFLLAVAAAGAVTTHWIEHRGPSRPLPRLELHW
jgi:hypothetical protein